MNAQRAPAGSKIGAIVMMKRRCVPLADCEVQSNARVVPVPTSGATPPSKITTRRHSMVRL
jgi:hypothetical protein